MKSPVILFNLDMLYPWVPRIHEGLLEVAEAQGWRVILATYQGQRLIDVKGAIHARPTLYAALVTANAEEASACAERSFPCVFIGSPPTDFGCSSVTSDFAAMGRMAAEELRRCGYQRFALVSGGNRREGAAALKAGGFAKEAGASGGASRLVEVPPLIDQNGWLDEASMGALTAWAEQQNEPIGVAAVNVRMAWCVARALRRSGKRVPEDMALVAIGEDPVLLGQARPPVSGVAEDGFAIGKSVGGLIAGQLTGSTDTAHRIVPPRGFIKRESTDFFSVDDPVVARALVMIWQSDGERLTVDTLAQKLHVSRATLLRRFREHRGHPPADEIKRARLRKAVDWITRTDQPFAEIADRCGFGLQSALSHAIRRETGKSPSALRRSFRRLAPHL
ncbi:MAG: helix-turn-helix domain-containing protein [Opitutales bacterium]|nr:helix-turn-helix domain-containing protein [Opitutales bacterium]